MRGGVPSAVNPRKCRTQLLAAWGENKGMNVKALTVAQLEAAHAEALASLSKTGSGTLYRTRLRALGAVSAELANRK